MDRETPADLIVARYDGVLSPNLFVEAQYSRKEFGFRGTGGTSAEIVESPFMSPRPGGGIPSGRHYNAPYFSSFDPEDRNNRQYAGALSYFLSTARHGAARPEVRRRVLHVLAHGRQLAVGDGLRVLGRPGGGGRAAGRGRERPHHPQLHPRT